MLIAFIDNKMGFTSIFSIFPDSPTASKPILFAPSIKLYKVTPSLVVLVISLKYSLDTSPP